MVRLKRGAPSRPNPGSDLFGAALTYDEGALPAYAELGRACLAEDPAARPTFEQVVEELRAMSAGIAGAVAGHVGFGQRAGGSAKASPLMDAAASLTQEQDAASSEQR